MCKQLCLHAERECRVRIAVNQLKVDGRDCGCTCSVYLDKTNENADSAVFPTPRADAMNVAKEGETIRIVATA